MALSIRQSRVSVPDPPLTACVTLGALVTSHAQSEEEPSCPCWVPKTESPRSAPHLFSCEGISRPQTSPATSAPSPAPTRPSAGPCGPRGVGAISEEKLMAFRSPEAPGVKCLQNPPLSPSFLCKTLTQRPTG